MKKQLIIKSIHVITIILFSFLQYNHGQAQSVILEGYAYESGNRGWLNEVRVEIKEKGQDALIDAVYSGMDGKFVIDLEPNKSYDLHASKDLFEPLVMNIDTDSTSIANDKVFAKLEMKRAPGYIFDITLADKKSTPDEMVDAIRGARIEVYNNTKRQEELFIDAHTNPDFKVNLLKGNHYTLMIRKEGYLVKRLEAFVDVEGCILCLEGFGSIQPGVTDNLTEGNLMGTLLANIEMDKAERGKKIELNNIYFATAKWDITDKAAIELDKAITFLTDNPGLILELGAHTDSRGSADSNQTLSQKRAKSSAEYLIENGDIDKTRLSYRGYGENQLFNKCADGVKCSKWEHSQNRRTELKITGEIAVPEIVSLKAMKEEEHKAELLKELLNQEQIRVPSDGDVPDEIKKQIKKEDN